MSQSEITPYPVLGSTSVISYDESYDYSGQFLLTARVGANAGELYRYSGNVKISDNTMFIQGKNLDFLYSLLIKYNLKRISFGTGQPLIKSSELKKIKLMFPQQNEEIYKIEELLKILNEVITLEQEKMESFKQIKLTLLSKLFPSVDKTTPEIRFKHYDNNWIQRELKDIATRIIRKNKNQEADIPLTISDKFGLIDQREYFTKKIASKDMSHYILLKNGEFAYNKSYSKKNLFGTIARLNNYTMGALSTLYLAFKINNADSTFIQKYYESDKWHYGISKIANEGARNHGLLNIATKDFFSTQINLPVNLNEQIKIGEIIESLDNVITLEQKRIDQYQQIKHILLQNLFI